jgi:hypothetical protein
MHTLFHRPYAEAQSEHIVYVAGAQLYEHITHKQQLHPQQPLRVTVASELGC